MGFLSRLTDWSRPTAELLLVAEDTDSTLVREIAGRMDAVEMSYELTSTFGKPRQPCVHFLCAKAFLRSPIKKLAATNQLMLSVSLLDLENQELVDRLSTIETLDIIADSSATASKMQSCGCESVTTISEGIWPDDFEPAGINRRLEARRKLNVPRDAQCVGVFEPLGEAEQTLLADAATKIHQQVGPVCLVLPGRKTKLDRELQAAGISVMRVRPRTISDLVACYWLLDMYLNISQFGDLSGVLRSWATGVSVVSRPNAVADDILRDGLTAAVSESADANSVAQAAVDLCRDEDFRHGCCARGMEEVHEFAWPKVADRYVSLYSATLNSFAVQSI